MYIRKCPKCSNGKMKQIKMARGWGKEYLYQCQNCGHEKWIYEGNSSVGESYESSSKGFWLLLLVIESIVFFTDEFISPLYYSLYIFILLVLLYKIFFNKNLKDVSTNKISYEIIDEIDEITQDEEDEELFLKKIDKNPFPFYIFVSSFLFFIFMASSSENYYYLIGSLLSLVYAYFMHLLDIS